MAIEAKTIDQQIDILKSRGLIIKNENFAKDILSRKNYYNIINAFKEFFIDNNNLSSEEKYLENTTFEAVYSLYKFDLQLRELF